MKNVIYISGPMTGLKDFNYPAFYEAELKLKEAGFNYVMNPARTSLPPKEPTWENYMKAAISKLMMCQHVATLEGAYESKGAREEIRLANLVGIRVMPLEHYLTLGAPQPSAGLHPEQKKLICDSKGNEANLEYKRGMRP